MIAKKGRVARTIRDVGDMDERITIQEKTDTVDVSGGMVETWDAIDEEEWSTVEYAKTGSDEENPNGLEYSTARLLITIRYRGDVTVKNRVLHGTKIYDIERVATLGRDSYEVLTCVDRGEEIDYIVNGDGAQILNGDGAILQPE